MQVETIYTFKNYLYIVTSGFLSQNTVEKIFYKTNIPLALVGYEKIIANRNSALRASLAIYQLLLLSINYQDY